MANMKIYTVHAKWFATGCKEDYTVVAHNKSEAMEKARLYIKVTFGNPDNGWTIELDSKTKPWTLK